MDAETMHASGTRVAVILSDRSTYPEPAPFHPSQEYPELSGTPLGIAQARQENGTYAAVRQALHALGLDRERYGTTAWNPLGQFIRPGDHVLVKPNWVLEGHHLDGTWHQIITHGATLRATIDYVAIALGGKGTISLADGPMQSADFERIVAQSGVREIEKFYRSAFDGLRFEVLDLRDDFLETRDDVIVGRRSLPGDPRGSVRVDLGRDSEFFGFRGEGRYYGADYDTQEVNRHHRAGVQEYRLSGTALSANVIIDVPKLKTHQKVGLTLSLKGVVGLNCGRNWLPHRTQGTPDQGGDQFSESGIRQRAEHAIIRGLEQASLRFPNTVPGFYRVAKRVGRQIFGATNQTVRGGGWYGNDTLWRMVLDINRVLTYATLDGALSDTPVRARFCIVDGIVAGEGTGPIYADAKPCGVIVAGTNPVSVDVACAELMGFDYGLVPMLANALRAHALPLHAGPAEAIEVVGNRADICGRLQKLSESAPFEFRAPLGWVGHMERRALAGKS